MKFVNNQNTMYKKNDFIKDIIIEKIWYWWVWIWKTQDWIRIIVQGIFVVWTKIDIRIKKIQNDFIEWTIINNSFPNEFKINENICPHHIFLLNNKKSISSNIWCWWCKWQIFDYETQLEQKKNLILDCFRNSKYFSKIQEKLWEIIKSPLINWYRNKIEFTFWKYISKDKQNEFILNDQKNLWFNKNWDFSKVIDIQNCKLISDKSNKLYLHYKKIFFNSWIEFYDKKYATWVLRHFIIREWFRTNEFMINLCINSNNLKSQNLVNFIWLKKELIGQKTDEIKSFIITNNNYLADSAKSNLSSYEILYWNEYIFENIKLSNWIFVRFKISPFAFFQVNTYCFELLIDQIYKKLNKKYDLIFDLYCWVWTIWICLYLMWIWNNLIWIEENQEAINDAKENLKINKIENNINFICWKVENELWNYIDNNWNKNDILIILDPPRSWLHKNVLKYLIQLKKSTNFDLIYISCSPLSLSNDLEILLDNWFSCEKILPIDFFPNTYHIENIVFLK